MSPVAPFGVFLLASNASPFSASFIMVSSLRQFHQNAHTSRGLVPHQSPVKSFS